MSHDTIVHRLVRPVVRRLAPTGVTPNQLTTLRLATGLASAVGFAAGRAPWTVIGAAVMLLSLLLDRADGELARQTGRMSPGGYRYDLVADCLSTVAAFLGMGWGVRAVFGPAAVVLGVIAGVSVVVVFWQVNVAKVAEVGGYRSTGGRLLFNSDDAMLLAPVLVWLGWMPWVVLVAATATPLVVAGLAITGRRRC